MMVFSDGKRGRKRGEGGKEERKTLYFDFHPLPISTPVEAGYQLDTERGRGGFGWSRGGRRNLRRIKGPGPDVGPLASPRTLDVGRPGR